MNLPLPTRHRGKIQALGQLSQLEKQICFRAEECTHTANGPHYLAA